MTERIKTVIILSVIFIPLLLMGGWVLKIAATILGAIIVSEMLRMKQISRTSLSAITAYLVVSVLILSPFLSNINPLFTPLNIMTLSMAFLTIGTIYSRIDISIDDVSLMLFAIYYIGNGVQTFLEIHDFEILAAIYILVIIIATDTGAYLFGRKFGKHKLAPKVSPNKTIEGSIGGIITALVFSNIFVMIFPVSAYYYPGFWMVILISLAGQMGDLIESAMKRHYQVKDSGTLLPGHGGIFDRFDSLIFVMNIVSILMNFGVFSIS